MIIRKTILLLIMLLAISACATPPVAVNFISTPHLNPDLKHRSLPVVIRVYELTQKELFVSATFRQLWHEDKATLGNTFINRQEWIINPNSHISVEINKAQNANYLGIIALFRNPDHKYWRLIQKIPDHVVAVFNQVTVKLSHNMIQFVNTVAQVK